MKQNVAVILVVLGVGAAGCCLVGGALMWLGYSDEHVEAESKRGNEAGENEPPPPSKGAPGTILGEWIDTTGPRDFFAKLRAGAKYEDFASRHVGQAFSLAADGTCTVDQLFGQTVGGCMRGSWIRWDDCHWKLEGSELTLTLGEGSRRVLACTALEETTVTEPGKTERRRVALNADGSLSVTTFEPTELTTTYQPVR